MLQKSLIGKTRDGQTSVTDTIGKTHDEGDIRVCGIAVLDNLSSSISVILILNHGIPVFSKPAGCGFFVILDGIKNSLSSPPTFTEPPVSDRFIFC